MVEKLFTRFIWVKDHVVDRMNTLKQGQWVQLYPLYTGGTDLGNGVWVCPPPLRPTEIGIFFRLTHENMQ